jgi:hypothetical protein
VAQGAHTTRFTGGGAHSITMANPIQTEFGELSLQSIALNKDTLLLSAATTRAVILSAGGNGWIRHTSGSGEVDVQGLNVNGARIQGVRIVQNTSSAPTLTFDNVFFSGFSATDVQISLDNPGAAAQITFTDVDFDNIADGTTGFYVKLNEQDAGAPFLNLRVFGPDNSLGLLRSLLLNGALIQFFPPS